MNTNKSDFTDETDATIYTEALEPARCRISNTIKPKLFFRCKEGRMSIYIYTGCFMSDRDNSGLVEYRFDDKPADAIFMTASSNSKALGLWTSGPAARFWDNFPESNRFIVRYAPHNESPVTAKFDISGFEEAAAPVREACGWTKKE